MGTDQSSLFDLRKKAFSVRSRFIHHTQPFWIIDYFSTKIEIFRITLLFYQSTENTFFTRKVRRLRRRRWSENTPLGAKKNHSIKGLNFPQYNAAYPLFFSLASTNTKAGKDRWPKGRFFLFLAPLRRWMYLSEFYRLLYWLYTREIVEWDAESGWMALFSTK